MSNNLPKCIFVVINVYSTCIYILTLRTGRLCPFYVNPNVTIQDNKMRKVVITHETDKWSFCVESYCDSS